MFHAGGWEYLNLIPFLHQITKVYWHPVYKHFTYLGMRHSERFDEVFDRLVPVWGYINFGLSPVRRKEINEVRVKKKTRLILHVTLFYTKSGGSYKFIRPVLKTLSMLESKDANIRIFFSRMNR